MLIGVLSGDGPVMVMLFNRCSIDVRITFGRNGQTSLLFNVDCFLLIR